jgi:hypothetical protein
MASIRGKVSFTAAESFWYVVGCIWFGGMYFAKVPVKKALSDAGLAEMTSAERFWYVLQCIAFGAGYFAKVPVKKALSEMTGDPRPRYGAVRASHGISPQPVPARGWRDSQPEPSSGWRPVRPESHDRPGG